MAPKFRGNSDDWLDDEASARRLARMQAAKRPKPEALEPEKANSTVAEVFPKQCRVRLDADGSEILCGYRRSSVIGVAGDARERSPVAVGDRVLATRLSPDSGVVEGVCKRRNALARPAPGREDKTMKHVLAANVDLLAIVASIRDPAFSAGLVDRFLVAAAAAGIDTLLCPSKIDLLDESAERPWETYRQLGFRVIPASARRGDGIEELREHLLGKLVVFCGHSGVGKTSLLRALLRADFGKVATVSEVTGKGRHTTSSAVLLPAPAAETKAGEGWIDTPGVREFGLVDLDPKELRRFFPEFRALACPVGDCLHLDEEGCLARPLARYGSYRRILESLLSGEY